MQQPGCFKFRLPAHVPRVREGTIRQHRAGAGAGVLKNERVIQCLLPYQKKSG
jgi:hypothetical protein